MYTMMQVCRQLDMTYQTLKYYCNEGLIPNVKRDSNNRRIFDEKDVKWIKDLTCLKKCGMSIQEMKEYLQSEISTQLNKLRNSGSQTIGMEKLFRTAIKNTFEVYEVEV